MARRPPPSWLARRIPAGRTQARARDTTLSTDAANPAPAAKPRVAALVVTWNRRADLERCLRAIAAQTYPAARLDVVVVDNASTDGTADDLFKTWRPDRVVQNSAATADAPGFSLGRGAVGGNAGSWRSLMLVRNEHNLGGCGGFNTAFLMVERTIAAHRAESMVPEDPRAVRAEPLEYVWLIDDDATPAPDCLERLVAAAQDDPAIGIVGSRMVDPTDRATTLESTVFFNPSTGLFGAPEPGHPRAAEHHAWLARVGDAKGRHDSPEARAAMSGVRDVECVAACSMLARWGRAREIGYWDSRFFIAGDDADWCLRFLRAGHRVVCCMDAVVFHLPWSRKQTPMQDYYRRRNLLWMWERTLPQAGLKRLARARLRLILTQAWDACWRARTLDAEILRRCAHDAATNRGGRLDLSARRDLAARPLAECLNALTAGSKGPATRLAVVCPNPRVLRRALRLRARARRSGGATPPAIEWILLVAADALSDTLRDRLAREPDIRVVPYGHRLRSRLKRQLEFVARPPRAWVILDGRTDVPLVRPVRVLHVDSRAPDRSRLERILPGSRLLWTAAWLWTRLRCAHYLLRLTPRSFQGRFGSEPRPAPARRQA